MHGIAQYLYCKRRHNFQQVRPNCRSMHTNERRTGQEIRDQLQTTTCCKIRDSSAQAARIRDILADKSWEEKEMFVTTGLINGIKLKIKTEITFLN